MSEKALEDTFDNQEDSPRPPKHLAYVEWLSRIPSQRGANHLLHHITHAYRRNEDRRLTSIIPVSDLCRSTHLIPQFGQSVPAGWTSANVLERCKSFFINAFSDRHMYLTID